MPIKRFPISFLLPYHYYPHFVPIFLPVEAVPLVSRLKPHFFFSFSLLAYGFHVYYLLLYYILIVSFVSFVSFFFLVSSNIHLIVGELYNALYATYPNRRLKGNRGDMLVNAFLLAKFIENENFLLVQTFLAYEFIIQP